MLSRHLRHQLNLAAEWPNFRALRFYYKKVVNSRNGIIILIFALAVIALSVSLTKRYHKHVKERNSRIRIEACGKNMEHLFNLADSIGQTNKTEVVELLSTLVMNADLVNQPFCICPISSKRYQVSQIKDISPVIFTELVDWNGKRGRFLGLPGGVMVWQSEGWSGFLDAFKSDK